jgi:hypothetical protein
MNDETAEATTAEMPIAFTAPEPPQVPQFFTPATNYWQITGNPKVFKAATNTLVATNDAAYTTWLAAGNTPTPISSESDLWGVMRTYLPEQYPEWLFNGTTFIQPAANNYTPAQIRGYAAQKRWETETGGISFEPRGGPSQGVMLPVNTSRESQSAINGAATAATRYEPFATQWKGTDNVFYPIDADTMILMGGSLQWHVKRCFDAEENCKTYTTLSQVDDEFLAVAQITYPDPAQP